MKRLLILFITAFILTNLLITPVQAAGQVDIYLFYSKTCPHCQVEKVFLQNLIEEYPEIGLHSYEVTGNQSNLQLMVLVGNTMGADVSGVPLTVIGDQTFSGYLNDQTSGEPIKQAALTCLENSCPDTVGDIIAQNYSNQNSNTNNNQNSNTNSNDNTNENNNVNGNVNSGNNGNSENQQPASQLPEVITLPLFGEINVQKYSLPVITIIIGGLDGFNPCAMWVLLFLISLLLGMENKRRMWILGITFLTASAAVYFIFMAAWLNLLLFIGFVVWVRAAIGLFALGSGGFYLKKYLKQRKEEGCDVMEDEKRQRTFAKLKSITQNKTFIIALLGIITLAFAVNLVELICSAGFPAIFTQILSLSGLSVFDYYFYIALYVFIFLLDDIIIFVIAMLTLKATGVTTKYSKISSLIGGILMVIIGILLLFKPEWLIFS